MRSGSRVWLSAFPFIFFCVLISSGRLFAQQTTGAPASSNAIDQLTGPIALHPDPLIFQVLAASTNVDTVKSFAAWMGKNATLKGSELQDAALKAGFDAPYVALAPFPQVVQMMAQQPDWTKALGQAYTADEKAVFDSIQRLRAQALAAGNLKTTSQQKVETQTTSNGQQVIVVQPANPQVIYVPTYNPQTVYVAAPPPAPSGASVAGAAAVGFTAGVIIGSSHNSYYRNYDDYWDDREDYYEDRQQNYQQNQDQRQAQANQDQRQSNAQANQDQRQTNAQANQPQRQADAQANQDQRQANAQANQPQRQSGTPAAQPSQPQRQPNAQANQDQRQSNTQASQPQRQSGTPSAQPQVAGGQSQRQSGGGRQASVQPSGMSSGGLSGYESGSTTRAQSSRGSSSLSSSRGGGAVAVAGEGDNLEMNRRTDMRSLKFIVIVAMLGLAILFAASCSQHAVQAKFASPQEAAVALHQALKAETPEKLQAIFGREWMEAAESGDPVSDQHDREVVALAMEQPWHWEPAGENTQELIIGDEQWPFPVPLVKVGNEWQFDSEEGKEEILARRIGRNELRIIDVCRAYAQMQKEYASQPHDGKPAGLFAQRFRSSPGRQDGLVLAEETRGKAQPTR